MHAFVTGASSGIGRALAIALSREGYTVTLVARREAALRALAAELPGPSYVLPADLVDPTGAPELVARAVHQAGHVDVLINNAGVQEVAPWEEVKGSRAERTLALNLHTPLRLIDEVLPGMLARSSGHIVNISSVAALVPMPLMAHYAASKAGLAAASESLAAELRGTGVAVTTAYPGPVDTPMAHHAQATLGASWRVRLSPTSTPDTLALAVLATMHRGGGRVIRPRAYQLAWWLGPLFRHAAQRFAPGVGVLTRSRQ